MLDEHGSAQQQTQRQFGSAKPNMKTDGPDQRTGVGITQEIPASRQVTKSNVAQLSSQITTRSAASKSRAD